MKILLEKYSDNLEACDLIRLIHYTSESVFLTGKAGTGKSTLLKSLVQHLRKSYVILAPTGIAALNVEGQTLHSFFQLEPRPYLPFDKDLSTLTKKENLLLKLDLIIIDEISMVRSDLMNAVDLTLRKNLKSNRPFGGKQLLVIGDLFQLPPVVDSRKPKEVEIINTNYSTPYFFSAKIFENGFKYHFVELQKVYRQSDPIFVKLLNAVRENSINQVHISRLNERYNPHYSAPSDGSEIILATTNIIVQKTNEQELEKLKGKLHVFEAITTGVFKRETSESKLPADKKLQLRVGAQVMFIKNDPNKKWVNGSIGKIISIGKDQLQVHLKGNNQTLQVNKVTWESYEYVWNKEEERVEKTINGTFEQFPLKLAWAVTIHKSQGQSFDKIIIDLGNGAFATGQTYVALSRCRSFNGIVLKSKVQEKDIQVDQKIKDFIKLKNVKSMEREKFEVIALSMQRRLNELEPLNIELQSKLQQIDVRAKALDLKIAELRKNAGVADARISTLTNELHESAKQNGKKTLWIIGLIILSLILIVAK